MIQKLAWLLILAGTFLALWIYTDDQHGVDEYEVISDYYTDTTVPPAADSDEQTVTDRLKAIDKQAVTIPEDAPERLSIDWEALSDEYPGIVGWIFLPALEISYPVMQAGDNEYYLHRDPSENYLYAGSIFMDCSCGADLTNLNTVLYGHNMRNGTMFGRLKKYNNTEILESCPYFWYSTPNQDYLLRIFSIHVVSVNGEAYLISFEDSETYAGWVSDMLAGSEMDTGVETVPKDSRVMTLSTCNNNALTRQIVQGYILWQGDPVESAGFCSMTSSEKTA